MALLTSEKAITRINKMYERLMRRRREVVRFTEYYEGKHRLVYATEEWRKLHQERYRDFADNWCAVVGSAPAERTEVTGFRLSSTASDPLTDQERQLWADWEINDLPAQSSQGFVTTTIAKRSVALVWGNEDDEPIVTWEHPAQVIIEYDPVTRRPRFLLKVWTEDDDENATLYAPDQVWKYSRKSAYGEISIDGRTESGLYIVGNADFSGVGGGGWQPRQPDGDDTWPIDNPFGEIPAAEFLNRPMLGGAPQSDIAGTIAMQDAINMLWAYLFVAADYASMPARVVLGQEPPKMPILDANGQKVGERPVDIQELTRGRMLWLTGQKTEINQWEAAKLDVFTNVVEIAVRHVSAQTRTPIYLVHGELGNVNGETLAGLDAPLVSKVRSSHKVYRSPTQNIMRLMALVRGNDAVAEQCRQGVVAWANPETRSDAQISDAALKDRQVGWPFQAVLERRYGLEATEIARIMQMRQNEANDPLTDKLLASVNDGGAGSG